MQAGPPDLTATQKQLLTRPLSRMGLGPLEQQDQPVMTAPGQFESAR